MGWTSTGARFYTADGKVNRKAECDALYTWEGEKTKNEVIKSSMRGSVYYAAVRTTDKTTGHSEVFAAVCLTSTRRDGGFNFGYKGMAEDMGPCEDDCPKSILVLLTDTESKYAKEWRERCWAKIRDKKQNRQSLASIKIGEIIEFERGGVIIRAEKMAPAYQFKTPWFKVVGEFEYVHKTEIKDWRIVADNAATPTETPQISTEASEVTNVSTEGGNVEKTPKYSISERDGNVCVTFMRGVIRECAKRCGVSCKSAEWNTIAQAYNGIHSDMGMGLSFFFDGREDAVRFAELVCNGDISGYYELYMDKIIAEGEARKKRIAEECAEYDAAQAHFAECMANEDAETVNVSAEGENAAERAEDKPYYTHRWKVLHNCDLKTWDKFHKKHKDAILVFHHGSTYSALQREAVKASELCGIAYEVNRHGVEVCQFNDATLAQIIGQGMYVAIAELPKEPNYGLSQPPQSPETPQTAECAAESSKLAQTA